MKVLNVEQIRKLSFMKDLEAEQIENCRLRKTFGVDKKLLFVKDFWST